jgi:hypothetical protein
MKKGEYSMFKKDSPLTLRNVFSYTILLFKKTFQKNIVIASIFLIPSGIIIVYGVNSLFTDMLNKAILEASIPVEAEKVIRRNLIETVFATGNINYEFQKFEAIVEVDENDITLLSVGDTARINIDVLGVKKFNGIITKIANSPITPGVFSPDQVVNYEVIIKLLNPDDSLIPRMSCSANIEVKTIRNAISISIESVTARAINDKENEEVVFVYKDGKARMVPVETGISDDKYIEIKSGLHEGEVVVSGSYRAISRELTDGSLIAIKNDNKNLTKISLISFYIISFFFSLCYLATLIGVTTISYSKVENKVITFREVFQKIFSYTYLRCFGQSAILEFITIILITLAIIMSTKDSNLGFITYFACVLFVIYLFVRWYFGFIDIVCHDKGIFDSFHKSAFLIKDYWWHTFGKIILVFILIGLVVIVIAIPINFIFLKHFTFAFFKLLPNSKSIASDIIISYRTMESVSIAIIIGLILNTLITPLFNIVLYSDLKIRKKDF